MPYAGSGIARYYQLLAQECDAAYQLIVAELNTTNVPLASKRRTKTVWIIHGVRLYRGLFCDLIGFLILRSTAFVLSLHEMT